MRLEVPYLKLGAMSFFPNIVISARDRVLMFLINIGGGTIRNHGSR